MEHLIDIIEFSVKKYILCTEKKEKSAIKYGAKMLMRQLNHRKHLWSEAAATFRDANNIPENITWVNQPRYDPGRKNLLLEHKNPLEEIWKKMLIEPSKTEEILSEYNVIVWVSRAEDDRLNELGYRSKRPDSDKAYAEAGIKILHG